MCLWTLPETGHRSQSEWRAGIRQPNRALDDGFGGGSFPFPALHGKDGRIGSFPHFWTGSRLSGLADVADVSGVSRVALSRLESIKMFEEIVIWSRVDPKYAIRYLGFRNLETNKVWIAFANHLSLDHDRDLGADETDAPQLTLESLLGDIPDDDAFWRPSAKEAIAFFIASHPEAE